MSPRQHVMLISLLLTIATITVYWQVHEFDFVSFDDDLYVFENQRVQQGLSVDNLIWAFNPSTDEAIVHYKKAIEIQPGSAEAHSNLANALCQKGKIDQGIEHYLKAIQLKSDLPETFSKAISMKPFSIFRRR